MSESQVEVSVPAPVIRVFLPGDDGYSELTVGQAEELEILLRGALNELEARSR